MEIPFLLYIYLRRKVSNLFRKQARKLQPKVLDCDMPNIYMIKTFLLEFTLYAFVLHTFRGRKSVPFYICFLNKFYVNYSIANEISEIICTEVVTVFSKMNCLALKLHLELCFYKFTEVAWLNS